MAPITAPITAEEEAHLLAREMVADLERYNESVIESGRVPRQAIREARAQFRARVEPALHPLFERALGNSAFADEAEPLPALDDGVVTDRALERAGLPMRRAWIWKLAVAGLVVLVAAVVVKSVLRPFTAVVLARLPIPQIGVPAETRATLPGPATLTVAVTADTVSWSGSSCLMLDLEAFRGATRVAHVSCCGWRRSRGGSGSALLSYRTNSDCDLAVPAGGADRVKVATRLARPGALQFEGLEVRIEK